jgi:hypothetical protein
LAYFGKSFGKNLLARSRKQSAQRAMPPQQQHTKSQGQLRESAALCGIACVSLHFGKSFGKNIWQDHVSRAHSEPCRRNNSTRSHSASGVHLRLFAVYVRVAAFWQELWQEPQARSRKQSAQRAMPPQQQHTKSQRQLQQAAAFVLLCCMLRSCRKTQLHAQFRTAGESL